MTRVKAVYGSWAIPCTGKQVYAPCHRAEWIGKITEPGVRRRAENCSFTALCVSFCAPLRIFSQALTSTYFWPI
jgi:hypothetical protein